MLSGAELHPPATHDHDTLYLKRGADDFNGFGEETPTNTDRILIEDNSAGLVKKWAQVGNLPGSGGEINTASNVGTGDGVWKDKDSLDLRFKSLKAGANVTLTPSADEIEIASSGSGGTSDHALLSNLGFAASGHSGFAASGANSDITSITGITSLEFATSAVTSRFVYVDGNEGSVALRGGDSTNDARVVCYGENAALNAGSILFRVPNDVGSSICVAKFCGGIAAPPLQVYYGLDMNSKNIELSGDVTPGTPNTYDLGKSDNKWATVFATSHRSGDSYLIDEKLYLGSSIGTIESDDEIQFKPSNVHSATLVRTSWGGLKIDKLSEMTLGAGITFSHDIDMNSKNIASLADPRTGYPQDATTKAYVDALYPSGAVMGDIIYHNGSAWTRLTAGTNGWVLTTHGGGANPTWAEGGSGGGADYTIDGGDATSVYTGTATIDCGAAT